MAHLIRTAHIWITQALLCCALSLALASPAAALSISLTGIGASLNPGHTADANGNNGSTTSVSAPTGGGTDIDAQVGDTLSASNRYTATVWRTSNSAGTRTVTANYRITFDVNADAGVVFDVDIAHDLAGLLRCDGDCSRSGATVTNVTATAISTPGVVTGDFTQATATATAGSGTNQSVLVDAAASVITLSGLTGSNTVTLDFAWTTTASGERFRPCAFCPRINARGTANFGLQPQFGPGYPGGTPDADDGHFVDVLVSVTQVPEPSVATMLLLGLSGLAYMGRRRD